MTTPRTRHLALQTLRRLRTVPAEGEQAVIERALAEQRAEALEGALSALLREGYNANSDCVKRIHALKETDVERT